MYEPVKLKKLRELAEELTKKLEALQLGHLTANELEGMTEHSRELYERLVVLRHKAYDAQVKEDTPPSAATQAEVESSQQTEVASTPIAFKIEEPKAEPAINQVSLIDVIEEVTKAEPELPQGLEAASTHQYNRPVVSVTAQTVAQESVYDKLSKSIQTKESLAQKLEHNPIQDLKKAITLNQRFQFSRELFKGNNQDYEVAIDKLNSISRDEAMKHLSTLRSKYAWSDENVVTSDFVSLVERRHQG